MHHNDTKVCQQTHSKLRCGFPQSLVRCSSKSIGRSSKKHQQHLISIPTVGLWCNQLKKDCNPIKKVKKYVKAKGNQASSGIFSNEEHDKHNVSMCQRWSSSFIQFWIVKCLVLRTLASKLSMNTFNYLLALHVLINIWKEL